MVVAQAWGVRIAAPTPQVRYSCFDFFAKKGNNQSFVRSVFGKPISWNCRTSALSCRCCCSSSSNWDWNQWSRTFSEIEQAESFVSVLKFQLEDAIEKEDFQEAAKLKDAIAEAISKDAVAEILSELKNAIDEERYHDASRLCRMGGSGLVGWWVGCSKDSDDPFGRVVQITPGIGRFVARCYSPRQLVTGSPGIPLFEIFVIKDADETYITQVVSLHKAKGNSTNSSSASKLSDEPSNVGIKSKPVEGIPVNEEKVEGHEEKNVNIKDANEEGIRSVISFLKDKIPGLKLKVMNIKVPGETTGGSDNMEQLVQESNETTSSAENSEDETGNMDDIQTEEIAVGEDTDTREEGKDMAMKLFIGGVLHNKEDGLSKDEYVRHPAEIIDMKRDSFVLHVPSRSKDVDVGETKVPEVKVAAVAAPGVSELMPHDVAKAFLNVDKVSRDVREIVKLAVNRAHKWNNLSGDTTFSRIVTSKNNLDPFDGLYVGAFGPYGTEVVQLRRKYGHWHGVDDTDDSSDVEFFEYVEAVKLTGDLNVPAGQVTFRAKIGKGCRTPNRGMYPDELGVVASYKGQGRIAEFGFRNPRWVDGELLQLKGKGLGPYVKGADLGFLYVVSEQSFLVLFNRLKLPE